MALFWNRFESQPPNATIINFGNDHAPQSAWPQRKTMMIATEMTTATAMNIPHSYRHLTIRMCSIIIELRRQCLCSCVPIDRNSINAIVVDKWRTFFFYFISPSVCWSFFSFFISFHSFLGDSLITNCIKKTASIDREPQYFAFFFVRICPCAPHSIIIPVAFFCIIADRMAQMSCSLIKPFNSLWKWTRPQFQRILVYVIFPFAVLSWRSMEGCELHYYPYRRVCYSFMCAIQFRRTNEKKKHTHTQLKLNFLRSINNQTKLMKWWKENRIAESFCILCLVSWRWTVISVFFFTSLFAFH